MVVSTAQAPSQTQQPALGTPPPSTPSNPVSQGGVAAASPFGAQALPAGLNVVVLDPAHGGTDPRARGTGGIRESEIGLDLAIQVRRALELQAFQEVQYRQGHDKPSFCDHTAPDNTQRTP